MSKTPLPLDDHTAPTAGPVRFESTSVGVAVVDETRRKREHLGTTPAVDPVPVSTDRLRAPVDGAVRLPVDRVETVDHTLVTVRDGDFGVVDTLAEDDTATYPPGRYVIDLSGPIKRYLQVEGRLSVSTVDGTTVTAGPDATVLLGARSKHARPTTEVTVPPTVDGLVCAVSTFGAALTTTTPDRSWPTLRGHPPAVTVGDEFDVPPGLAPPCPEVQVLVPPTERHVYTVAPLVHYLGAELVTHAGPPQVRTDEGFVVDLDGAFEATVERTLKRVVFLECLLRSEGLLEYPLHERSVLGDLPVDPATLFDRPPEARLPAYFDVDYDAIADEVPDWELAAHVAPRPEQVELLPYLVDDLAVVRTRAGDGAPTDPSTPDVGATEQMQAFFRSGGGGWTVDSGVDLRDDAGTALETVWTGDGLPVGASKVTRRAYENRLDRSPDPPPIDVAVVCNDDRMNDELDVTDRYDGEKLPMNVSTYRDLSRSALRTLLEAGPVDFLHYIGHADPDGLHCSDGALSLSTVSGTGVEAFLLNACRSFDQGLALIDAGAIGGVVTRRPVPIEAATDVGRRTARLLNAGYPLRAVADVVRETTHIGDQYQIVGDGGHAVAQRDSAVAFVHSVQCLDGPLSTATEFAVSVHAHPAENGLGGVYHPYDQRYGYYLIGNDTQEERFTRSELAEYLGKMEDPTLVSEPDENMCSILWPGEVIRSLD